MNEQPLEIERKYLIKYPDRALLDRLENCKKVSISQTYLLPNGRVRRWECDRKITYFHTVKQKISDLTRIEIEREINTEEYEELLQSADPDRKPIEKVRYRYTFQEQLFEIDLFPFWSDRAFCETELQSEDETREFPPFLEIIKEVTFDKRYTNRNLAKSIPFEKIF